MNHQPTLYVIHEGTSSNTLRRVAILRESAERLQVPISQLDSLEVDYTDLPRLAPGDMLFNCARGSEQLETLLLRPLLATFYSAIPVSRRVNATDSTIYIQIHERAEIPGPRTVHRMPRDPVMLAECARKLGGFPVVAKKAGGTKGAGVVVLESPRSLISFAEYAHESGDLFILREFVPHHEVARIVVVGARIVGSIAKPIRSGDFRSSTDCEVGTCRDFGSEFNALAIRAAETVGREFAGVDIVSDVRGAPLVLEINPPCDFTMIPPMDGMTIGDHLVGHLIRKSNRILSSL